MKVCVQGMWHLGVVTAACLAHAGHDVTGLDDDGDVVRALTRGEPPVLEPGLVDLVTAGVAAGRLHFTTDPVAALRDAAVLWVAFDTPVDEDDRADTLFVEERVKAVLDYVEPGAMVLVSSQLPVGATAGLEEYLRRRAPDSDVTFAYSPENLRLGRAIDVFTSPDRIVVGIRSEAARRRASALLDPITDRIEWMSVEAAEMTKHAINAFLATSIAFMNELSTLCEKVGADAKDVERGLKTESRIGHRAYLAPGAAIAGGTLARDLGFLSDIGRRVDRPTPLVDGVRAANEAHKQWAGGRLLERLCDLEGKTVGVLGLTYKPGTNTLRRSSAVETCLWLAAQGVVVHAHDPAVHALPVGLRDEIRLADSASDVLKGLDALLVATEWPEYRQLDVEEVVDGMRQPIVVDPNGFLRDTLGADSRVAYDAVGVPR
ncbi:UDP-glucose/GDP-mannose dehydrogenase family protein [Mycolicibacterium sp. P1-18]|uniref:UDP-glucose dehydrogenase family protein n=1 Tax=Mycolicibacterium sp. P1-18 TaxID=2024615 RepID=UPI0011F1580A|nr:nucleotide sugar dehydrogenase [Mycolicibacterium sp. P1-18]KAA0098125.1 UDP-glucose/GDP-mannose dehydrogenase family protein [Mycolicibacterium sp. P1-18]